MNQAQTVAEPAAAAASSAPPSGAGSQERPRAHGLKVLPVWQTLAWAGFAIVCFHLAYGVRALAILIVGYVFGVAQLTRVRTTRLAGWIGFGVGFLTAAPQLTCFWTLFGPGALGLWSVLGFWMALFVVIGRFAIRRCGTARAWWLLPILWTGLEYFRSELYYLKFSWMNVGYCLSGSLLQPLLHYTGVYGAGFLATAVAPAIWLRSRAALIVAIGAGVIGFTLLTLFSSDSSTKRIPAAVPVAGIQLEFPTEADVVTALDSLIAHHPEAELLMLSEYAFMDGPVPQRVRDWCRERHKYLLAGGKHPAKAPDFYDTAFLVGPWGEIVFEQGKSVPVQFMKDGLPATSQRLWQSPWGKIGICICYDLSYTRVTDRLVQLGAQALLIPTMDVVDWGRHEHELHARVAPVRATEYGVPVFRVASSGISQFVDSSGETIAKAGFPGDREEIFGNLALARSGAGHVPWDRWLALACVAISAGLIVWLMIPRGRMAQAQLEAS
jgi:apolipoprotein N-acyltransferase